MRLPIAGFLVSLASLSFAQSERYFLIDGFKSMIVLGSEEKRQGLGVALQWTRPEPRFKLFNQPGLLVWEAYSYASWGHQPTGPNRSTVAIGGLAMGRYVYGKPNKPRVFWEAGWGLQGITKRTYDLDSPVNSTPVLGVGALIPFGDRDLIASVRWLHVSNGGTRNTNHGQNQLFVMFGIRF